MENTTQLTAKQKNDLASGVSQPDDIIKSNQELYQGHIQNFEEFFKSRLNFVIETSLNHIELKVLLERIVGHDKDMRFSDLSEMLLTIFGEVRSEAHVLYKAYSTARAQITNAFENCGQDKTTGILFRYR